MIIVNYPSKPILPFTFIVMITLNLATVNSLYYISLKSNPFTTISNSDIDLTPTINVIIQAIKLLLHVSTRLPMSAYTPSLYIQTAIWYKLTSVQHCFNSLLLANIQWCYLRAICTPYTSLRLIYVRIVTFYRKLMTRTDHIVAPVTCLWSYFVPRLLDGTCSWRLDNRIFIDRHIALYLPHVLSRKGCFPVVIFLGMRCFCPGGYFNIDRTDLYKLAYLYLCT
jgi:hypothetical protein